MTALTYISLTIITILGSGIIVLILLQSYKNKSIKSMIKSEFYGAIIALVIATIIEGYDRFKPVTGLDNPWRTDYTEMAKISTRLDISIDRVITCSIIFAIIFLITNIIAFIMAKKK
jgi:hypothetical protein